MTIFDGYIANLKNILKALWLVIMNIVINLSIPISLIAIFARWWLIFSFVLTYPLTSIWYDRYVKRIS